MNSKFVTPLIFTSALAIGALSFVACGGDEGSDFSTKPENPTPSSAYVPPEPTPQTSIQFANMAASVVSNKVKFKGDITLDLFDSTAIVDFNAVRFIDLQVTIVNSQNVPTGNYTFGNPIDFNANRVTAINFQEADLYSNLTEGYTECGNFSLMITATASDGTLKSVSNYTIPFTRSEEFCKEPESSSSSAPKIPGGALDTVSVKVSTKTDKCLDIATGIASSSPTGDICFNRIAAGKVSVSSTTGLLFTKYDNQNDAEKKNDWMRDWYPTNPTTDDFQYVESTLVETYPDILYESDVFFVAINPNVYKSNTGSAAGFYAFIVNDTPSPDGNDVTFTLLIYRAK